jgi:glycosyltransferase involved in cell wall biosynthesis
MLGMGPSRGPGYRLLLITYHWPPAPGSGASRWGALAKYLRRAGHSVTIVTTDAFGTAADDEDHDVHRTRDLVTVDLLRRAMRRPTLADATTGGGGTEPPGLLTQVVVPDAYAASWVPFAARTGRRLLQEREFDCVITSSPPDSVHLAGLALGRRRPPWIAELRDGWIFEPLRPPFRTRPQRELDRRLELRVARTADEMVGATRPITADLEARLGATATTIQNAWDPELDAEVDGAGHPPLGDDRTNLVYTGTLGGVRGHDESGLLGALRAIVTEGGSLSRSLRLVIAGALTESERATLSAPDLAPVLELLGQLPRPQALALQRDADALLLITSNDTSIATGKVFEYLGAGRPILALAGENEAARIVRETRTGSVVAPDDASAVRQALGEVASGELASGFEPRELDRYLYPAPADALLGVIERVLAG